ncbi:DUF2147 domain-containing protein [Rhizobium sp. SSA_523]|uniref:DUF2147 domain-containing protein n=1 Tax=Rhizobium sp. SSA_523 TaxID=2952477 RepID=UPI002090D3A3|nr:DUF2147 domain-containing protein [Rhizobium sp. SSA_523]MCO5730859.1 DUF2147 domain-containing protein [Rhizobium sp. SSA_523]WKC24322.1 DUF2147 domain-containing protein [Rhizobium sp. SSA_523]
MIRRTAWVAAILFSSIASASAAEPIVGSWKTASGETATIAACGSAYCVTLKTGKYAGKQIGKMSGTGGSYKGEITDPAADKTYSGSGSVTGNALKMKGCVMSVFCKTQTWTRL